MLVNRWGILWKPLRCDLARASVVVGVCCKLHNFIIDEGNCRPQEAEVFADTPNGMKRVARDKRERLRPPLLSTYLSNGARPRQATSETSRAHLLNLVTESGLVRPAASAARLAANL